MSTNPFVSTLQNLLLMTVSTVVTLLLIEGAFRLYSSATEASGLEALNRIAEKPAPGTKVTLGSMIQLSANPGIVYELIPDLSVVHLGQHVTTNAAGFRGPAVTEAKPAGTRRIVGLGDSVMFGWGVAADEAYPSVLAQTLNAVPGEPHWEFINTAVPGYNTAIEVEVLKEKGLRYQPDIVIVGFVANDFAMPRFIRQPVNYLSLDRSFLLQALGIGAAGESLTDAVQEFRDRNIPLGEVDMSRVPPHYHYMVGTPGVINSFNELRRLRDKHGFEVIVLVYQFLTQEVRDAITANDFQIVNAAKLWAPYAEAQGYTDVREAIRLSESDPHPSAEAHAVIAKGLSDRVRLLMARKGAAP
ncbi:MAG: hypothetical protein Hals2KO_19780 [Halioglobus sp.]